MYVGRYKDRTAIVIEGASLIATVLPQDGGKLASLRVRSSGKELLAVKTGTEYNVLAYDGDYVSAECSGFDDMFPTVDPYTPEAGNYRGITYPDHGEACRLAYDATPFQKGVVLRAKSRLFPITYQKTISAAEDGGIDIEYHISNHGEAPFDYLWAGHIMLQGENGIRVFTPFDKDTPTEMMFATRGIPESKLPLDRLIGYAPGAGAAYKFYYLSAMKEGCFGLSYPDGSRLVFGLDPQKVPYLGIWFNNGEFQDLYSITPEPCTVPFDAPGRARQRGYASTIPVNGNFSFNLHISWKENGNEL